MGIKHLFDELKSISKKKYYSKNGEEMLIFTNKNGVIEIYNLDGRLDIVISQNGSRDNYINSNSLNYEQKMRIKSAIQSYTSLEAKCKVICIELVVALSENK